MPLKINFQKNKNNFDIKYNGLMSIFTLEFKYCQILSKYFLFLDALNILIGSVIYEGDNIFLSKTLKLNFSNYSR